MGIVNATPDSFSDAYPDKRAAIKHAEELEWAGADILDIGGESTRPGSESVTLDEELARVIPVIKVLVKQSKLPISIDTQKAEVARAALEAGATIINHVSASLDFQSMLPLVKQFNAGYVAMHMRARPKTMQENPHYENAILEVTEALRAVKTKALELGISEEHIVYDPGIGFGKLLSHNLELLQHLAALHTALERPLLLGISRKSWLRALLGPEIDVSKERDAHSALASVLLQQRGVLCHRVHNVGQLKRAFQLQAALRGRPS